MIVIIILTNFPDEKKVRDMLCDPTIVSAHGRSFATMGTLTTWHIIPKIEGVYLVYWCRRTKLRSIWTNTKGRRWISFQPTRMNHSPTALTFKTDTGARMVHSTRQSESTKLLRMFENSEGRQN